MNIMEELCNRVGAIYGQKDNADPAVLEAFESLADLVGESETTDDLADTLADTIREYTDSLLTEYESLIEADSCDDDYPDDGDGDERELTIADIKAIMLSIKQAMDECGAANPISDKLINAILLVDDSADVETVFSQWLEYAWEINPFLRSIIGKAEIENLCAVFDSMTESNGDDE